MDSKFTFDKYIKRDCKKVSNELRAPSGNTPDMTIEEKKILLHSFFET